MSSNDFTLHPHIVHLELPREWSTPDWISFGLAVLALLALTLSYIQFRQSKKDILKVQSLMVRQINREHVVRIYADTLAGFRTTLKIWSGQILDCKIEGQNSGRFDASGNPLLTIVLNIEQVKEKGKREYDKSQSLSSIGTYEHMAQLDLIGEPKLVTKMKTWAEQYSKLKLEINRKLYELKKEIDDLVTPISLDVIDEMGQKLHDLIDETGEKCDSLWNSLEEI